MFKILQLKSKSNAQIYGQLAKLPESVWRVLLHCLDEGKAQKYASFKSFQVSLTDLEKVIYKTCAINLIKDHAPVFATWPRK